MEVVAIIGFRKKIEVIPIKKVVQTGPTKDLKAERLDALIITNSDVRERLRYIANVDKELLTGEYGTSSPENAIEKF